MRENQLSETGFIFDIFVLIKFLSTGRVGDILIYVYKIMILQIKDFFQIGIVIHRIDFIMGTK